MTETCELRDITLLTTSSQGRNSPAGPKGGVIYHEIFANRLFSLEIFSQISLLDGDKYQISLLDEEN